MTKQDIIREEIALRYSKTQDMDYVRVGGFAIGSLPQECYDFADNELEYLRSQGVVIKVERELPRLPHFGLATYCIREVRDKCEITQRDMLKTGFVAVEPLIEREDG